MKYRHATTWKTLENNMLTEKQSQKTIHYMTQFIHNVQSKQVYRDEHNKGQTQYVSTEDIKKRWQEYTELYTKDLNDPDNHNSVVIHLEPDVLEAKSCGP